MTKELMSALLKAIATGDIDSVQQLTGNETLDWLATPLVNEHNNPVYAIHYASQYGQLELVQLFLDMKPDLLHVTNLIGETVLDVALNNNQYDLANFIILRIYNLKNNTPITSFIRDGKQALDLMLAEPALISLLLPDNRVLNLIKTTNSVVTEESIAYYNRRPSFCAEIDRTTGTSSIYTPVKELGTGTFGRVRLFQSDKGQIGVKSLHKQWSADPRVILQLQKEAEFNQKAYPIDMLVKLFKWNSDDEQAPIIRYVMSYVKGTTARLEITNINCAIQLANIILNLAEELHRIHELGIIHGDLSPDNIIIHRRRNKEFIIRYIDFGLSYYTQDNSALCYEKTELKGGIPPELCNNGTYRVPPATNQDVYQLGYTLTQLLSPHPEYLNLCQRFPSIASFIAATQAENPEMRPSLSAFCSELTKELKTGLRSAKLASSPCKVKPQPLAFNDPDRRAITLFDLQRSAIENLPIGFTRTSSII